MDSISVGGFACGIVALLTLRQANVMRKAGRYITAFICVVSCLGWVLAGTEIMGW